MYSLFDIEKKYKNELEDIEEWAYLRSYYRKVISYGGNKVRKISKIDSLKSIFYGFPSWFRRYKYFVFSGTAERRDVKNILFDKNVDFIIDIIGRESTLLIDDPSPYQHFKKSEIHTKHIVSRRLLDMLVMIIEKFIFKTKVNTVFNRINKEYGVELNFKIQVKRFNARYILYKLLFKLYKVEVIIVSCYYSKQHILKVANDLNIKTIEIQHGVITEANDAYLSYIKLDNNYFPEYLLSLGENEEDVLKANGLISKEVIAVGSFYLDYISKNFIPNSKLQNIIKNYKTVIGVSLQKGSEEKVLNFILDIACLDKNILYIIIPRTYQNNDYNKYDFPSNIIFFNSLNCYQIIMHCNYHCTFYSACAIEVPSLNIPNILLNFNNMAQKYYLALENRTSKIVENSKEFLDVVYSRPLLNIKSQNSIYIKNDYQENIKKIHKLGFFNNLNKELKKRKEKS